MKHWHDLPLLKSINGRQREALPAAATAHPVDEAMMYNDLLVDDDLFLDDGPDPLGQDPDIADRDLLAAVLAQTGDVAELAPKPAPETDAPVRDTAPMSWGLTGFDGQARITTSFGELPIMALRRRDKVKTESGAFLDVKWIDEIRLDADFIARHHEAQPIMIRARGLDGHLPKKNVLVSPGQVVWAPKATQGHETLTASKLEGRPGIMRTQRPEITYYRFHCGEPVRVCIEGAWFLVSPEG